jgi:hypothetical protein
MTPIVGESDDYVDTAEDRKQDEYDGDEQYYSDNGYEREKNDGGAYGAEYGAEEKYDDLDEKSKHDNGNGMD